MEEVKLGAHLSIARGLENTIRDVLKIKAGCLQIFSSPPRNWKKPKFTQKEIEDFKEERRKEKVSPLFIHAKYLINLSSKNQRIRKNSINSLVEDLNLAQKLDARGVIFHLRAKNLDLLLKGIERVLQETPKSTFLILENSAQSKIEEIGKVFKKLKNRRLKFCLDLAHAFQAGYDLRTSEGIENIFKIIKKEIDFENLVLIHANDSKTDLGSYNDRHQNIGEGKIGEILFFIFLNHPVSSKLPFIIETPGFGGKGLLADKKNLAVLKRLKGKRLEREFFKQPTEKVAKLLLGKYLIVDRRERFQIGKITETEAYVGPEDKASHAFSGKTERNKAMWGRPGTLYVYLIYGIHHCLNIVTEQKGFPAAVLIRRLEPIFGIFGRTDGPGKICKALGITRKDTGLSITEGSKIYIKDIGWKPERIISAPRIGVEYAKDWAERKLRFYI